jgi:hypothetical protein
MSFASLLHYSRLNEEAPSEMNDDEGFFCTELMPQSYYFRNADNVDTLRKCIRDARLASRNPTTPPVERHLHRIVVNAGLQLLHHSRNRQATRAKRAKRLVKDAIRQLENIQLEAALAAL